MRHVLRIFFRRCKFLDQVIKMSIEKIDPNFRLKDKADEYNVIFHDDREAPFKIFGVFYENDRFVRMPKKIAESVSNNVAFLANNTAGGRVCFETNSRYIVIHADLIDIGKMPHFTTLGSAGFDMYIEDEFCRSFVPPYNIDSSFISVADLGSAANRRITINFPLYSGVSQMYIGLSPDSDLRAYSPYDKTAPIVYYGSSITQGGCASRPGNSYQSMIARKTGVDYINLGFSGSAKGETEMADYIAGLEMSIFVMDYDHNAPSAEHLLETHEKFFKIIRDSHRELPVVFVTKPDFFDPANPNTEKNNRNRRDVVYTTFINAFRAGDKNVYFLEGSTLFNGDMRDSCTVDGCHPNDLGFYRMAQAIGGFVSKIRKSMNS